MRFVAPEYRTSDVCGIFAGMRSSRDWSALPILADALQDAGCDDSELLADFRNGSLAVVMSRLIVQYVMRADGLLLASWPENPDRHESNALSKKWSRIETVQYPTRRRSCHSWIAIEDFENKQLGKVNVGGIHKSASWKAAAKHERGNLFNDDWDKCMTTHGIIYLK